MFRVRSLLVLCLSIVAASVMAGPPFFTDDPEPVEEHHWEYYVASQQIFENHDKAGTAPHVEINYGAIKDLQLHLIAPLAYDAPSSPAHSHYGLGDLELGLKYRFLQETDNRPQIAIFPLVEVPTGNDKLGLGNGKPQVFIPVWLQKSFGNWSTYGGGGYWFNGGKDNKNYGFFGWQGQRKINDNISLGAEIFHSMPSERRGRSHTGFNIGGFFNVSDNHHILFSAGRDISGPRRLTAYLGYQLTFGPKAPEEAEKK